jgi:hypothetical protein
VRSLCRSVVCVLAWFNLDWLGFEYRLVARELVGVEVGSRGGNMLGGWGFDGVLYRGEGFCECVLYWGSFINKSNIGLCKSAKVSFICSFLLLNSYMWKRSRVLSKWPFSCISNISIVFPIAPYVCSVSSICWAYFEGCLFVCLFVFMARICSLCRSLIIRPVWPLYEYISGHSLHFSWYTPLCLYTSVMWLFGFGWLS